MSTPASLTAASELPARLQELSRQLHGRSGAAAYGISGEEFSGILAAILARYWPRASARQAAEELAKLRVEELALARGCAAGNEAAWTEFLVRFRSRLYEMAHAIARDESVGRELADGIYAELYGLKATDGVRASKLRFYCGRGSLEGWLRSVLAQEFINVWRKQGRLVSLEEREEAGAQFAAPANAAPVSSADQRLNSAVDAALAELAAEDRLLLAAYFLDGRTLRQVGRMVGVHESSVSRRLGRVTKQVRRRIVHHLQLAGCSRRQAEEALQSDVRDLVVDVRARLMAASEQDPAGP